MKKRYLLIPILFLSISWAVAAQSVEPAAILQYFDDPTQLAITDANGNPVDAYFGLNLALGDTIKTANSTAEIQLVPNGSIVKLADNTSFAIQTLQGRSGQDSSDFGLLGGTVRMVAARSSKGGDNYSIQTPTAVCGVRGTDFTLNVVPGKADAVGVLSGVVNFVDTATGQSINVGAGMYANTFAASFQPVRMSQQQLNELFSQMSFKKLVPSSVPGHAAEAQSAQTEAQPSETAPQAPERAATGPSTAKKPGPFDAVFNYLQNNLGMEIGTITINGVTYSQAVLEPEIDVGKLKLALYLPIIYSTNLFDYSTWYRPAGNNEWSFGTDQSTPLAKVEDFATDLSLKIRYLEWGAQRDPFYLRLGNLSDMTIGHGFLMSNYANNEDFPAVRVVGLNMGVDLGGMGAEGVVNNIGNPQIFGGRFYLRPFGKGVFRPAFGLSGIADLSPASALSDPTIVGNPIFLTAGTDLDFPIIQTDPLAVVLFADFGGMAPYFRNSVSSLSISQGLDTSVLYARSGSSLQLRNYGFEGGLLGNVSLLNWMVSFRNYDGVFHPEFFSSTYNRTSSLIAVQMADYVANPNQSQYQTSTSGIYGQAGLEIGRVVSLQAGYFWPWAPNGDLSNDFFHLRLQLKRGIIPGFGISAALSYDRTDFVDTLIGTAPSGYTLFDANTTMSAEVDYPLAPTLVLAVIAATTVQHSADGTVITDSTGRPEVAPAISIVTRVRF